MRTILTLVCLLLLCNAYAQPGRKKTQQQDEPDKVFVKVETNSGPDNAQHWQQYLATQLVIPPHIKTELPKGSYRGVLVFIVNTNGTISDIKTETDPGYGLGAFAISVVQRYPGKWRPAQQCGRLVKNYVRLPLLFVAE
jgi:hypothetical protein